MALAPFFGFKIAWCIRTLCAACVLVLLLPGGSYASESMQMEALADISHLQCDLIEFRVLHRRYPTQDEGFRPVMENVRELCTAAVPSEFAVIKRSGSGWPCSRGFGPPIDPWGHPYVYITRRDPDGSDSYGIYSCGPDGISRTNGNDPGDINSWNGIVPGGDQELTSRILWRVCVPTLALMPIIVFLGIRLLRKYGGRPTHDIDEEGMLMRPPRTRWLKSKKAIQALVILFPAQILLNCVLFDGLWHAAYDAWRWVTVPVPGHHIDVHVWLTAVVCAILAIPYGVGALLIFGCGLSGNRPLSEYLHCLKCDHILKGLSEPRCPECGEPI